MLLDLMTLKQMHPRLPAAWAQAYAASGTIALERRGHAPGCRLEVQTVPTVEDATLSWTPGEAGNALQLDRNRITEDGAEAVALALVSVAKGWATLRRLQRQEHADWLMQSPEADLVALEVSGVDAEADHGRLHQKLDQVARVTMTSSRWACVVTFVQPTASLAPA